MMKQFSFDLQAARSLWQRVEQEASEEYSVALPALQRARERLDALDRDLGAAWTRLRAELASRSRNAKVTELREACRELEGEQKHAQAAVDQAERAVKQALERLQAARKNREIVERQFQNPCSHPHHL
jgi:hypothetical protein